MPKKRIQLTVDQETYRLLEKSSKQRSKSLSSLSLSLIEEALELQEDLHFSRVADERLATGEKRIPHGKAWT